ncbi:MAG: CTP synthase [Candidatus Liptonbacteria bacterium]|nr:CTP synthase [Candidatus Liptonbacteria bacterium]
MTRYIFIVGGVMSGIGKGVATASIARILEDRGFKCTAVKIDPYINVDAGTMNPVEHGEVYVTEDGVETDQDIGNYERFLNKNIYRDNYMTTGLVYQTVINRERNLEYGGKCVEVVPHIPEEVISRIENAGQKAKADFVMIEIGGTVGEYQNLLFLEAGRMMKLRHPEAVMFVLVSYLPVPDMIGEMKTKPTQYAVRTLNGAGIQPDIVLARAVVPLDKPRKEKISTFCNVMPEDIISAPDVKNIYEIPINFEKENLSWRILKKFGLKPGRNNGKKWRSFYNKTISAKKIVKIGITGKYFSSGNFTLADSYLSVIEAIKHASAHIGVKPEIHWLDAESFEKMPSRLKSLGEHHGIIVPGGFGSRGVEGKIKAIKYARENKIPFLGLCYGLQLAIVEFARNMCGLTGAHTTEVNQSTKHPVIHVLPEQAQNVKSQKNLGGSMRLGAYPCKLAKGTLAHAAYKQNLITERHRHRYEVNNDYRDSLEEMGLTISGLNPEKNLVEIIELPTSSAKGYGGQAKTHPFFLATQFHPEFKSRPLDPHPLFVQFIKAAIK